MLRVKLASASGLCSVSSSWVFYYLCAVGSALSEKQEGLSRVSGQPTFNQRQNQLGNQGPRKPTTLVTDPSHLRETPGTSTDEMTNGNVPMEDTHNDGIL